MKVTIFAYFVKMKNTSLLTLTLIALMLFGGRGLAQAPHADSVRSSADSARLQHDSSRLLRDSAKLTDTAKAGTGAVANDDDGFDPALTVVFLVLVGIVCGAALIGAVICGIVLGGLFVLATAGILSAGVLVGLYRRSVTAGFRTAFLLAFSLGGILVGAGGFYVVNRYFHLHFTTRTVLLAGAGGGLLGGLLLGLIVFALIRALLKTLKQRLAF